MTDESLSYKVLYWHSRRGMLELDILLLSFARYSLASLSATDCETYRQLLACEDTELYDWLVKKNLPPDKQMQSMIKRILRTYRLD